MQIEKLSEEHIESLSQIKDIPPELIKEFSVALDKVDPVPITAKELTKIAIKVLGESLEKQSQELSLQLLALYNLKQNYRLTSEQTIEIINNALENSECDWEEDGFDKWKLVSHELKNALEKNIYSTILKTNGLARDYQNLLGGVRIISDVRPVFDDQADYLMGTFISHKLRIDFRTEDQNNTIEINMDNEDVELLLEACKRALKKASILKRTFNDNLKLSSVVIGEK